MGITEALYTENEKLERFEMLMNTKEYLTKEEYDFCVLWDKDVKIQTSYIGDYSSYGDYLNLNLYSEHDHEKRMES
tara:strand:- start:1206 stop:1433 length:228 start_codon:yes stop_codon:yes gene_type:complete